MGGFCADDVNIFAAHIVRSGMGACRCSAAPAMLFLRKRLGSNSQAVLNVTVFPCLLLDEDGGVPHRQILEAGSVFNVHVLPRVGRWGDAQVWDDWEEIAKVLVVAKAVQAVVPLSLETHADFTVETSVLRNPNALWN